MAPEISFFGIVKRFKLTGVLGQLYWNHGRIREAGEHERGRTPAVLGYVPQSDYRTNHNESDAAVILGAFCLVAVVSLGVGSFLAC